MGGRINAVVAQLVLSGLRERVPTAFSSRSDVDAVMKAGPEGAPLEPYRRILQTAWDVGGATALLQAGESVRSLSHPLLFVLLNSNHPSVLVEKENRLSGFIHSRHRVTIESETATSLTLKHTSEHENYPDPTESLAGCGQHIVLLEEIGCQGLRLRFPKSEAPHLWAYDRGRFFPPAAGAYDRWHFEWETYAPTRKPMPGLDELLLAHASDRELVEQLDPLREIERVVMRDLGRSWKIEEVAQALGTSTRSLQRTLRTINERYSDVVDRIRNSEAARLIRESDLSLTEIGYICGFADSAHFSRSFKKRFGAPPSTLRAPVR